MTRLFLALALGLMAGHALTAGLVKTPPQYLILKPKTPIVVDGKLTEWDMARTPYILSSASTDSWCKVLDSGPDVSLKGDADFSGRAALAWDETCLYVAGQMVDDQLIGVKPDSYGNQGPSPWFCDSLMVRIASFRQSLKTNSPYHPLPLLGLRYAPASAGSRGSLAAGGDAVLNKRALYWMLPEGSNWKVTETTNGYNVEASIPWKSLHYTARPGEKLFIGFLGADTDPKRGLIQIGWGFTDDPKTGPLFRLADRADVLATVTLAQDEVPLKASCIVRTDLDARTSAAKLDGVRVTDAQGKTVWQAKVGLAVPPGMTGTDLREINAGALTKQGRYQVEAQAKGATVARVPLTVVAPVAEPPLIKNLPGEIHHAPPDRVTHRGGPFKYGYVKGKADYLPYLRKHLEPGLKAEARNYINIKYPHGYELPLRCLAMYKITGDDEYVQLGRAIVDYTLDALTEKGMDWFATTNLIRYRYLTWKDDPNSPFAPKDAEKRFRVMLAKEATTPSSGWLAESGTHNRVWFRYGLLTICRQVAEQDGLKVDPRVIDYIKYHDKLIGEVGDSDDASAIYHWVFWDPAISMFFFSGDWDAFRKIKGYQKSLSRYVEMVSPSGACATFGSVSGWPEVGHSMWAYELMSRLTKDGRYRWTSHRIAEYYYNHLDYFANQYHGPYGQAVMNFTLAYLLADDSIAPKPPVAKSRVTWRHPFSPVPIEVQKARPGTAAYAMDGSRWIPDKLVLSSGNDPKSLWGMVELLPIAGHGGELPGNILTLMMQDSALFAGQGYYETTPDYQNILWIEDLDGLAADPRPLATEVPIFIDDPAFTFVRIKTTAYQHLPVTYTRDILFYKNGFLVVKDRAKFDMTMKVRLGPCYYARDLGPECGNNWFNTYYDQLYYTGLGLGMGVQAMRNPAWDLLVYFSPRPDRKHTVLDRFLDNPYRQSPIQLRQAWSGMVRAGQEITFTSVLLPHAPVLKPSGLITPPADSKDPKRIEVIRDEDNLTVVKVVGGTTPTGTWIMLNDTGKLAEAGPLASDGLLAVAGLGADGKPQQLAVAGGTILRYQNEDATARARKLLLTPLTMPASLNQ
ncbi:MAG: DOMON domain-containing protein [Armatimonadota bacterium]